MKSISKVDSPIDDNRFLWVSILIFLVLAILTIRLWYLQIYQGEYYRRISANNRLRKIEIPAPRGMLFDRNGKVILGNKSFYDLVYIPQYVQDAEKTLDILSALLHEPRSNFERMLKNNKGRPKFLPITIRRNLSLNEVSMIESNSVFLPGIEVARAPRRDYSTFTPAHVVGYIGEISSKTLKELSDQTLGNPYFPGDLIGKQGLELRWESFLRGKRGFRLIQVDAFGRQTNLLNPDTSWDLPTEQAIPGSDLILSIDFELQKEVAKAFQGKYGAVVVLNPQNGEILAMLSSPDYDPKMYQEGLSHDKWMSLLQDPYKPLFDKTTGGAFAPGSVYKPVIALAALQEGIINPSTTFHCNGSFELGRDVFHCHHRGGHGAVNLEKAMMKSCDVYFYNIGVELGVDRIAKYATALGLGQKLDVRLNKEDPGLIPTTAWKKATSKTTFMMGDIPSIAIGQGANLLTPMQIASLYSVIANEGALWRPIIVKKIINHVGEIIHEQKPEKLASVEMISPENFRLIKKVLEKVVSGPEGSGYRAHSNEYTIAGKTGTAQVVSLKKNLNRRSSIVSMKWLEHAMFAAFSPVENAEIAVAVVSENDRVGGGSLASAPIAGRIVKAYWDLKKSRQIALNSTK